MNNVALLSTQKLSRTIGNDTTITGTSDITVLSGNIDVGVLLFDSDGTMGVCTASTRNENDIPVYTIRTATLDTAIDVQNILSQSY